MDMALLGHHNSMADYAVQLLIWLEQNALSYHDYKPSHAAYIHSFLIVELMKS